MQSIFITCPENIEQLLFEELKSLGVPDLNIGYRGVFARKSIETVYKVNYCSRLATRVLWPLVEFKCTDERALYEASRSLPWDTYIQEGDTFAIDANISHPHFRSSLYGAQVMKDGVCDQIRDIRGTRPSIDVKNPTVQLNLFVHNQRGIISFDTSGEPLFKRGWRTQGGAPASIQENLAAALLWHAGYKGGTFCDPLCGSGTFIVEAALIATRTPPGFLRQKWGFFRHPEYREEAFAAFRAEEDAKRIPLEKGMIVGADKDPLMVKMVREYLHEMKWMDVIALEKAAVSSYILKIKPDLIFCNPPFGKRLVAEEKLFKEIGMFLTRESASFKKAYFLSPDPIHMKMMGVPFTRTLTFSHGGLRVHVFEVLGKNC